MRLNNLNKPITFWIMIIMSRWLITSMCTGWPVCLVVLSAHRRTRCRDVVMVGRATGRTITLMACHAMVLFPSHARTHTHTHTCMVKYRHVYTISLARSLVRSLTPPDRTSPHLKKHPPSVSQSLQHTHTHTHSLTHIHRYWVSVPPHTHTHMNWDTTSSKIYWHQEFEQTSVLRRCVPSCFPDILVTNRQNGVIIYYI